MDQQTELPFVSIIIPAYNSPAGIEDTIRSIQQLNYPQERFETIVIDNGSTDNTVEVIKNFESVTFLEENDIQGSYAARNKGIKASKGSVFAFTDADCIVSQNWLVEGVKALQDFDLVAGEIKLQLSPNPNIWEYYDSLKHLDQKRYVEELSFGATANLFVRKSVFEQHGLFNTGLKSGGDLEFGKRTTSQGSRIGYSNAAFIYHPARDSYQELNKKSKRVIEGQNQLVKMGVLEKSKLSLRSFVPVTRLPRKDLSVGIMDKGKLLLMLNYFKYHGLYLRNFKN